ncbi:hypothetical protein BT69DRAFT_1093658 [Atractiella rhizophila]|nr:hypothetical protein BT69DRAFT_1093658 [Atractiella rhizophila]
MDVSKIISFGAKAQETVDMDETPQFSFLPISGTFLCYILLLGVLVFARTQYRKSNAVKGSGSKS